MSKIQFLLQCFQWGYKSNNEASMTAALLQWIEEHAKIEVEAEKSRYSQHISTANNMRPGNEVQGLGYE